jgi:hypothetical protein
MGFANRGTICSFTWCSKRLGGEPLIPFRMARSLAEACALKTRPFNPSNGALPYMSGSMRLRMAWNAPRASQAPSRRKGGGELALQHRNIPLARLSAVFRVMFPTNPSQTTTSTRRQTGRDLRHCR